MSYAAPDHGGHCKGDRTGLDD